MSHISRSITLVALLAGCRAYSPDTDYQFHAAFERGAAHRNTGCDACHVLAPIQQRELGLQIPEAEAGGWVTKVDPFCISCHPFTAQLAKPLPTPQECQDRLSPVYESEFCRFDNYHLRTYAEGCASAAGCHSKDHINFNRDLPSEGDTDTDVDADTDVDTDTDTDTDVPPEDGHAGTNAEFIFPLQGAHTNLSCTNASCHPGGAATAPAAAGNSAYCGNCHTRAQESVQTVNHKPPGRANWTEDRERDCAACHVDIDTQGRVIWPNTWTQQQYDHQFLVPHNTVVNWQDLNPVLKAAPAWKRQCWSCHNTASDTSPPANPVDTQDGTSQNATPSPLSVLAQSPDDRNYCTDGCHAGVDQFHGGVGRNCTDGGCHSTGGAGDVAFE